MSAKSVLEFAKANNVKMVDLRFTDLPGLWHHVTYPIHQVDESSFEEGFGMDGSSIRGWAAIHESDMLLVPDPSWYMLDPFTDVPTLVLIGDIADPIGCDQPVYEECGKQIWHHLESIVAEILPPPG